VEHDQRGLFPLVSVATLLIAVPAKALRASLRDTLMACLPPRATPPAGAGGIE